MSQISFAVCSAPLARSLPLGAPCVLVSDLTPIPDMPRLCESDLAPLKLAIAILLFIGSSLTTYYPAWMLCLFSVFRRIKLCDLGLAKVMSRGEVDKENYVGTPSYLAPEVACIGLGMDSVGAGMASDWFSVGVCLFEMAFGLSASPFLVCNKDGTMNIDETLRKTAQGSFR